MQQGLGVEMWALSRFQRLALPHWCWEELRPVLLVDSLKLRDDELPQTLRQKVYPLPYPVAIGERHFVAFDGAADHDGPILPFCG